MSEKVLLVTGGGRGIGAATARLAARQGYAVGVNYAANQAAAAALVVVLPGPNTADKMPFVFYLLFAVGAGWTLSGWLGDEEVSVGIWGRGGPSDANSLHVLVYRLRKELQKVGFDPWFIEKRRRALRVRLRDVKVD